MRLAIGAIEDILTYLLRQAHLLQKRCWSSVIRLNKAILFVGADAVVRSLEKGEGRTANWRSESPTVTFWTHVVSISFLINYAFIKRYYLITKY